MQDPPEKSPSKRGLLSAVLRSPLFWALLLMALVIGLMIFAPALRDRYTVL